MSDEVVAEGDVHEFILADAYRGSVAATDGRSLRESEQLVLLASVTLTPNSADLPGGTVLQSLIDGVASWALLGALAALVIGSAMWAIGNQTQNMQQSSAGRRAVVTALVAAILLGAAPALINFFFTTGGKVN